MSDRKWSDGVEDGFDQFRQQIRRFKPGRFNPAAILVLAGLAFVATGWYTVQPQETAVIQRFGEVVRTTGPGFHLKYPLGVEKVSRVPTARVLKEEFGFRSTEPGRRTEYQRTGLTDESLMLTGDLNVIDVQWIVQYRIQDPVAYFFKVRESRETIRDMSEAVMRRVVGNRLGSDVLTTGRVSIASEVEVELQEILSDYETGVRLVTVELQDVTPPDPVKPAFDEVNEARQDKERMINQAQERANQEIPRARGEANQSIAEAEGYATERINRAEGEAARFTAILEEYRSAPQVTRRRLYLEAMRGELSEASGLFIVDSDLEGLIPLLSLENLTIPPGRDEDGGDGS